MTDYSHLPKPPQKSREQKRRSCLARFMERYKVKQVVDLYCWLWEGEFGIGEKKEAGSIASLYDDTNAARQEAVQKRYSLAKQQEGQAPQEEGSAYGERLFADESSPGHPVCENLGCADAFLKVRLLSYAQAGCPLKILYYLYCLSPYCKTHRFRFQEDWLFAQKYCIEKGLIAVEDFTNLAQTYPLHLAPELQYSEDFLAAYGSFYRLVPKNYFLRYFPEYKKELSAA